MVAASDIILSPKNTIDLIGLRSICMLTSGRVHASDLNPGFVTFVVRSREPSMDVSFHLHADTSTIHFIEHRSTSNFSAGRLKSFSEAFIN